MLPDLLNTNILLLVSALPSDRAEMQRIFTDSDTRLYIRTSWQEGLSFLRQNRVPVVVCDAERTATNWQRILAYSAGLPDPPSLIVSSRLADERLWAEVLNLGGYDVLYTPFNREEVLRVTRLAFEFWQREREDVGLMV